MAKITIENIRLNGDFATVTIKGGAVLQGDRNMIFGLLLSMGIAFTRLYNSESMGLIPIESMQSKHVANAIAKIIRHRDSTRWEELSNLFEEYRSRVQAESEVEG